MSVSESNQAQPERFIDIKFMLQPICKYYSWKLKALTVSPSLRTKNGAALEEGENTGKGFTEIWSTPLVLHISGVQALICSSDAPDFLPVNLCYPIGCWRSDSVFDDGKISHFLHIVVAHLPSSQMIFLVSVPLCSFFWQLTK